MQWPEEDDTDEEINEPNDTPIPCADPSFREHLVQVKHELYEHVVYSPEVGTDAAQDLGRLQDYLKLLNRVYLACLEAQKGRVVTVDSFPPEMRESIRALIARVGGVREKPWEERIPYARMVDEVLHEDPFVQH
jgi:hypothetical protein